jgi:hypothetical protein
MHREVYVAYDSVLVYLSKINSMERKPSWKAYSRSVSRDIPWLSLNRNVHRRVNKSPSLSWSWARWIQTTWSYPVSSKIHFGLPLRFSYEGVSKSFRTGRLERELQMVQLSATRCSCIALLWVSLVSFAVITLCIASQRVFIVVSVYFVINSIRKRLDTPSYLKCVWILVYDGLITCTVYGIVFLWLWMGIMW